MDEQPETTKPIKPKLPFSWRVFICWLFVFFVLYVLGYGPVEMMAAKRHYRGGSVLVREFYRPLRWVYNTTPIHKPLGMYLHLWAPKYYDKNGDYWRPSIDRTFNLPQKPDRETVPLPTLALLWRFDRH
jgi:hypothetical protein